MESNKELNVRYRFKNGTKANLIYDSKGLRTEWGCDPIAKNLKPIHKEYIRKFVPYAYQQMANLLGQKLMWIDSKTLEIKHFTPIK